MPPATSTSSCLLHQRAIACRRGADVIGRLVWRAFLIAWSFACLASTVVSLFHQQYAYSVVTGLCAVWIAHLQTEFRWSTNMVDPHGSP